MSAKPVLVNGQCYVPLDVMKAVLPYPVSYEAKRQRVRFDPPQKKVAHL
jgi:saccharopine dehydrogenase-like NADP-dependent oxidoreductase